MGSENTPFLPSFPTITVRKSGMELVGSAPGVSDITAPLEGVTAKELNAVASRIALQIAEALSVRQNVRVNIIDADDRLWAMWLDRSAGVLREVIVPSTPQKNSVFTGIGGMSRPRKLMLVAAACLMVTSGTIYGVKALTRHDAPVAVVAPSAVQLPVIAPAGWDTYADYALDSNDAKPFRMGEYLVYAKGSAVHRVRATDGVEVDSQESGSMIRALYQATGLGVDVVAVDGGSSKVSVGRVGEKLQSVSPPSQTAKLVWAGGTPVWQTPGYAHVPDVTGALHRYTAPAGSALVAVTPQGGWFVSESEPKAWFVTDDSVMLPDAIEFPLEKGAALTGNATGVGSHLVVGFTSGGKEHLKILDTEGANITASRTVKEISLPKDPSVDASRGLLMSSQALVDVATGENIPTGAGTARYGAGYAWVNGAENYRIDISGHKVLWALGKKNNSELAPVPVDVLEDGRAVVLYKTPQDSATARVYVLKQVMTQ